MDMTNDQLIDSTKQVAETDGNATIGIVAVGLMAIGGYVVAKKVGQAVVSLYKLRKASKELKEMERS